MTRRRVAVRDRAKTTLTPSSTPAHSPSSTQKRKLPPSFPPSSLSLSPLYSSCTRAHEGVCIGEDTKPCLLSPRGISLTDVRCKSFEEPPCTTFQFSWLLRSPPTNIPSSVFRNFLKRRVSPSTGLNVPQRDQEIGEIEPIKSVIGHGRRG